MGMAMGQQMGSMYGQAGAPASPPPLASPQFHVSVDGKAAGPYGLAQLQSGVGTGEVTPTTLVWAQGMAAWAAAGEVPALASLFSGTPPPIPGATPPAPPAPPSQQE